MKSFAIVLFVAMYVGLIAFPKRRAPIALATAAVFLIAGILPKNEIMSVVNWNVLLMIFGTLLLVDYFIDSKMPNLIADKILRVAPNVMWVTILMSLFSGIISAFIDNVATLLMVAPIGLAVCKKLKISPVPMVICIAVSSNLQGAATLVGDTTSIMLGAYAGMDFMDFFWFKDFLALLYKQNLICFLGEKLDQLLYQQVGLKVHDDLPDELAQVSEFSRYAYYFTLGGLWQMLVLWTRDGMTLTPEQLTEHVLTSFSEMQKMI